MNDLEKEVRVRAAEWTVAPFDETTRKEVEAMLEAGGDALIEAFTRIWNSGRVACGASWAMGRIA